MTPKYITTMPKIRCFIHFRHFRHFHSTWTKKHTQLGRPPGWILNLSGASLMWHVRLNFFHIQWSTLSCRDEPESRTSANRWKYHGNLEGLIIWKFPVSLTCYQENSGDSGQTCSLTLPADTHFLSRKQFRIFWIFFTTLQGIRKYQTSVDQF